MNVPSNSIAPKDYIIRLADILQLFENLGLSIAPMVDKRATARRPGPSAPLPASSAEGAVSEGIFPRGRRRNNNMTSTGHHNVIQPGSKLNNFGNVLRCQIFSNGLSQRRGWMRLNQKQEFQGIPSFSGHQGSRGAIKACNVSSFRF
jgi:hypothetical protein